MTRAWRYFYKDSSLSLSKLPIKINYENTTEYSDTQRNIFWILLNHAKFEIQLHCSASNQSEKCNHNLNLVWFNKVQKRFPRVSEYSVPWSRRRLLHRHNYRSPKSAIAVLVHWLIYIYICSFYRYFFPYIRSSPYQKT